MARVSYSRSPLSSQLMGIGKRWSGSLGIWGVGAGAAAIFLLSLTPPVKHGILLKVPVLGSFYEDKVPASDKPF